MIIRKADAKDFESVVNMAESFYAVSGYAEHIPFDKDTCMEVFSKSVGHGLCSVAETEGDIIGFILGIAAPSVMNKHYLMGAELAWWVEPKYRKTSAGIKLLRHIELCADELGITMWSMMCIESQNPDVVENMYLREGYQKTERTFTRFL